VPDQAPPKKPKNFTKMLDMLDTEAAVNTLSPKTYADMVGIFSRKAYENGELEIDEYLRIVKPLFGETGEMVTKKIENYRTNMLEGGDTEYNAMVTEAYIKAGGFEATGMDIDSFAKEYFKKFADGGRAQFNSGSLDPDAELSKRVKELMDDGYEFGQAVKQAMEETRKNQGSGTMPKSEKWMREYFFDGKGGYDDRMSYKEFALGPGQELYKKFGND
tara:strand:- start:3126 stop:3779 length:654 start_codon:yes stop_codon:yes gene_type:complete